MNKFTKIQVARPVARVARPARAGAGTSPIPRLTRRALICVWTADADTGRLVCSWRRPTDADRQQALDASEPPSTLRIAA